MRKFVDTILCHNKEDAKHVIDVIGAENVFDWVFYDDGTVRLFTSCSIKELLEKKKGRV